MQPRSTSPSGMVDHLPAPLVSPLAALSRELPPPAQHMTSKAPPVAAVRYGFRVGTLSFLIPAGTASEVLAALTVSRIPNSAPELRGMVNLRGNLVPVFDLMTALALPAPERDPHRMILVLGKAPRSLGLMIDGYPLPLPRLAPAGQLPPLPEAVSRHLQVAHECEGEVWLEVAFDQFFMPAGGHHPDAAEASRS